MRENCKCKRCGWAWVSRIKDGPKSCPGCKSNNWRTESKGRGNWVPGESEKVKMECSKCRKGFEEGQEIFRFQEGKNINGVFVPEGEEAQGLYCADCAPDDDIAPYAK